MTQQEGQVVKNKNGFFARFHGVYGTAGVFLVVIVLLNFIFRTMGFLEDLNMWSVMTSDEIAQLVFSVIALETFSSLILAIISGIALYFFIKIQQRAFVYAFLFLIIYPVLDGVVGYGYSGELMKGLAPLISGGILLFIFWYSLSDKITRPHIKATTQEQG